MVNKISQSKAKEMLDNDSTILLVDVREKEEYATRHITNAINVPLSKLDMIVDNMLPNHNATIFIYCQSGMRSMRASEMLDRLGYTNVYDIGGIITWEYDTSK